MSRYEPCGIGYVGCGSYNSSLASAAEDSELLRPVACYDPARESAEAFAEQHDLTVCATLDELLGRDDVTGVVIASPNNAHRENVEAAAAAGRHVFVDKPIANTIEDGLAIIRATTEAGVVLTVGHNGRRASGHRKMREMMDAGAIGTPVTVEANFSHSGGLHLTPNQWRYHRSECPALPLMQLGVHFADTVQFLLGDVLAVSSMMSRMVTPAENEDVTVSLLRFDKGLLGYLGSNYASPPVYYVNVYGTGGNLYCEGGGRLRYLKAGAKECEVVPLTHVYTQREELENFAECIRTGDRPEVDGEAALKALAIVRAALKSNELDRTVTIEEIIAEARNA